jgi:hypothetical protein
MMIFQFAKLAITTRGYRKSFGLDTRTGMMSVEAFILPENRP